ncbi:signal peptidase II [Falsirhodobacter sp. 20TX0035]|uniref:signal peptidase II n=1 Tax=Falsirhodobacter sp. 20TX0035 TaxID=3022019 RepID=UPI002330CB71|nr:signal peptidase II [Falsirhodobacter sp. 20TX0035]MDB6454274.1 signal peptidase II [Falsirhodobacter sp. 20TX0035]
MMVGTPMVSLSRGPWQVMLCTLLVDQATKTAALTFLPDGAVSVLPFFDLTLGFNTGASFGMMSVAMAARPMLMVLLTGVITLGFACMAYRATNRPERNGFALITGGALGNIVDRLNRGAVTDFLDFHWQGWHWPAFNIADVAIFIGAAFVIVSAFLGKRARHA